MLALVLKQQSIKVVKPFSVSPLLVKRKAFDLFSSKYKYGGRCRLHSYVSRNGQLTGICNALPNVIWKLREHTCATLKRNTNVLFSSLACSILASEVDLICLARNSRFTGFCHALSKMVKRMTCTRTRNTGTQEHQSTLEHSGTIQNTPEHPRATRNSGTAKKLRDTEFDDVVLISLYRPCKK